MLPTLKKMKGLVIRTIPLKGKLIGELGAYIANKGLKLEDRLFPITR